MPVSGRYEGLSTSPRAGDERLELRVDVDAPVPHTIVTNRVSGDLFGVAAPGSGADPQGLYRRSWIVDAPARTERPGTIEITGAVRFYPDRDPSGSIRIVLSESDPEKNPVDVELVGSDGTATRYSCRWKGPAFRDVKLEVDVCRTVGRLRLPQYDIGSHPERPPDLVSRTMTIESALAEAGIRATIVDDPTDVDDSAKNPPGWSARELHDALLTHFQDVGSAWPRWSLWGLLAGSNGGDAGLMFDLASPERQGFVVFRSHPWFSGLPPGNTGTSDKENAALRTYLFSWVHEIGHAFNLAHSWDKRRSKALSWMNYPGRFNSVQGAGRFWQQFPFVFDEPELIHIRHGNRASVIMGGDPMGSDGHLGMTHLDLEMFDPSRDPPPDASLELRVQGVGTVDLASPVTIEVRLRNRTNLPVSIDDHLTPQDGNLVVFIKRPVNVVRPEDAVTAYTPLACRVRELAQAQLGPFTEREPFDDRYTTEVDITYGRDGFYFDEPGEYLVRAVYVAADDRLIRSNILAIRVVRSELPELRTLEQDFFTPDVGQVLYLQGSPSPHLQRATELLTALVHRRMDQAARGQAYTLADARLAAAIADGIAAPFSRLQDRVVKRLQDGNPAQALELTTSALELLERLRDPLVNLSHSRLGRARARWKQIIGDDEGARSELQVLSDVLGRRGVHRGVLKRLWS